MNTQKAINIRPVEAKDRQAWNALYQGYAAFYKVSQTDDMRDSVWTWLHDKGAESEGLVAEGPDGTLLGLAHFRAFARPLSATTGCFLDDLFVTPDSRGLGIADALIEGVRKIAIHRGWSVVRWITAEDNYRGRAVYDRVAKQTKWVTYDIKI